MGRGPSLFPEDLGAGFRGWFRLLRSLSDPLLCGGCDDSLLYVKGPHVLGDSSSGFRSYLPWS